MHIDYELKDFWRLIQPSHKDGYVELRILPVIKKYNFVFFDNLKVLQEKLPNTIINKKICFFIKTYDEFEKIINFNNGFFSKNAKICYSMSERFIVNDKISGSYKFIKNFKFIFFDIEATDHKDITGFREVMFNNYIERVIKELQRYGLVHYTLVHSGAGRHLIYKIQEIKITESRKKWLKEFLQSISVDLNNDFFSIDNVFDATRVLGCPFTINVKRNRMVTIQELSYLENDFFIGIKKQPKIKEVIDESKAPEIYDSLEWFIGTHPKVPKGEIHTVVIFALQLLLKEKNITEWRTYERELNNVRRTNHVLNPFIVSRDKKWNPGIIINWCKRHDDWCKEQGINYKDWY